MALTWHADKCVAAIQLDGDVPTPLDHFASWHSSKDCVRISSLNGRDGNGGLTVFLLEGPVLLYRNSEKRLQLPFWDLGGTRSGEGAPSPV